MSQEKNIIRFNTMTSSRFISFKRLPEAVNTMLMYTKNSDESGEVKKLCHSRGGA
jgi:hypothetical protein